MHAPVISNKTQIKKYNIHVNNVVNSTYKLTFKNINVCNMSVVVSEVITDTVISKAEAMVTPRRKCR